MFTANKQTLSSIGNVIQIDKRSLNTNRKYIIVIYLIIITTVRPRKRPCFKMHYIRILIEEQYKFHNALTFLRLTTV